MFDQLQKPRLVDRKALSTEASPELVLCCNKGDVAVISQGKNLVCFVDPNEAIRAANVLLEFAKNYLPPAA